MFSIFSRHLVREHESWNTRHFLPWQIHFFFLCKLRKNHFWCAAANQYVQNRLKHQLFRTQSQQHSNSMVSSASFSSLPYACAKLLQSRVNSCWWSGVSDSKPRQWQHFFNLPDEKRPLQGVVCRSSTAYHNADPDQTRKSQTRWSRKILSSFKRNWCLWWCTARRCKWMVFHKSFFLWQIFHVFNWQCEKSLQIFLFCVMEINICLYKLSCKKLSHEFVTMRMSFIQ